MLHRFLDRPCTLALLIGFQFLFMAYFSFGGFRNLASIFGRDTSPSFDYSRTHDVYTNLSLVFQLPPRLSTSQPLPYCPDRSPHLSESDSASVSPKVAGTSDVGVLEGEDLQFEGL